MITTHSDSAGRERSFGDGSHDEPYWWRACRRSTEHPFVRWLAQCQRAPA